MTTVKYQAQIETPTSYTGYLVDDIMNVPMDTQNRDYQEVQVWIGEGNTPEEAYTQDELNAYETQTNVTDKYAEINSNTIVYHTVEYYSGTDAQNVMVTNIAKLNEMPAESTLIQFTATGMKTYLNIDDFKEMLMLASEQQETILDSE